MVFYPEAIGEGGIIVVNGNRKRSLRGVERRGNLKIGVRDLALGAGFFSLYPKS